MLTCKFCNKQCKNNNSLKNHERLCPSNADRVYTNGMLGKKGSNQYTKARELGLPDPVMSDETRLKISIANQSQIWDDTRRKNFSATMIQAVKDYPDSYTASNVCGRIKIEEYNGEKFHGKWEVVVAKWFDDNNIMWERKVDPFEYYWNNSIHLYFPDFYLPNYDVYIEVKGYETERDRCKWSVIPNLVVIKKNEIKLIKKNEFALLDQLV